MKKCLTALVAAFLCVLALALLTSRGAYAHGWYTGTGCCSGNDCAPVPLDSEFVQPGKDGYRIRLTVEQAQMFNPFTTYPRDVVIPYGDRRIKSPPVLKPGETYGPTIYHLCIPASSEGVYCLFVSDGV